MGLYFYMSVLTTRKHLYKFKKNCTNLILKLAGMGKNVNSSASG